MTTKVLVIDNLEPEDTEFNDPLRESLAATSATVHTANYRNIPPADVLNEQYDAVVISGAPLKYPRSVLDSRLPFLNWISTTQIPVLGICLGHQNIALLFDDEAIISDAAEDGARPLTVLSDDPLLAGIKTGDKVQQMHRLGVTLPPEFRQLASTEDCCNQIMKHNTKAIYSVQFHPELSPIGHKLLGNFVRLATSNT